MAVATMLAAEPDEPDAPWRSFTDPSLGSEADLLTDPLFGITDPDEED
jgi:hypothetical protein